MRNRSFYSFLLCCAISLMVVSCGDNKREPEEPQIKPGPELKDCQGNKYPTVIIGDKTWMAENLKCSKFDSKSEGKGLAMKDHASGTGDDEPICFDGSKAEDGSGYDEAMTKELRAKLGMQYSLAAALGVAHFKDIKNEDLGRRQGICPDDWHLPSKSEWAELSIYAQGTQQAFREAERLKSIAGWHDGHNGTDLYGFSALPAGHCFALSPSASQVDFIGYEANFWSSSLYVEEEKKDGKTVKYIRGAYYSYLQYLSYNTDIRYEVSPYHTMSVRCVKN